VSAYVSGDNDMASEDSSDTILRKTFYATMIGAVLFAAAVTVFVLA
jgi:hypothetical protein